MARRRKVEQDPPEAPAQTPEQRFMTLARARFKQAQDATHKQEERENEDLKFYRGDQWPADVVASRAGQNASNGLPPVPARPCLVINKVKEPVRQVLNQERQADMGIEIVPADDFGDVSQVDDAEIELREGLVRRIQRESHAADARTWAFMRATIAGRGFYRVLTRYGEGKTFDQEIRVERIYNQAAVTLDPAHEQPDGSDAEWGFIGAWVPWEQYKAEYPSTKERPNKITDAGEDDFTAMGDEMPNWFRTDGEGESALRAVHVVEYFYTERTSRELCLLPDGQAVWKDELPEGVEPTDTRTVVEKAIKWAKIDGANDAPLEETDWPGRYLPIIKVVGEELQPDEKDRRFEGMVRSSRDSQQGFNFMVSKWVEMIGLSPIPPIMVDPVAIEGYEPWYYASNTRTLPFLPARTWDDNGRQLMQPTAPPREAPIAAVASSVQLFDEAIKSTTGVPDPTLGNVDPSLKSGKAIRLVQAQAELGTSNYLDNMARSVRYEGMIINDLLFPIYGRPGRIARLVNAEGDAQTVTVQGPRDPGQPMPTSVPTDGKRYVLTEHAFFNVAIKVSKQLETKRQQEAQLVGDLIGGNPGLMGVLGDLFFKNLDGPGTKEMAERVKATLDPRVLAVLQQKEQGGETTAAMQIAQLTQQLTQVSQVAQEQQKAIETDAAKQQAMLQKAQLDNQIKLEIARMDNETKLQIEAMKATSKQSLQDDQQRHELGVGAAEAEVARQAAELSATQAMAQMGADEAGGTV